MLTDSSEVVETRLEREVRLYRENSKAVHLGDGGEFFTKRKVNEFLDLASLVDAMFLEEILGDQVEETSGGVSDVHELYVEEFPEGLLKREMGGSPSWRNNSIIVDPDRQRVILVGRENAKIITVVLIST